MSGIFWHILTFGVIVIFLIGMAYRVQKIARMPIHLRWELAPIPCSRGSRLLYMAKEIFFLRGIWRHNRSLWPFSFAFHAGIYLTIGMLFLSFLNAVFWIIHLPTNITQTIVFIMAFFSFLLGILGTLGLILKRSLDSNMRLFNTVSTYINLVLMALIFISELFAFTGGFESNVRYHLNSVTYILRPSFDYEMAYFINSLITLDTGIAISLWLSLYLIITLLFILYLPFSSMSHFVIKYFLYHAVRWNDRTQDEKMIRQVRGLLSQQISWSAPYIKSEDQNSWAEIASGETNDKKAS